MLGAVATQAKISDFENDKDDSGEWDPGQDLWEGQRRFRLVRCRLRSLRMMIRVWEGLHLRPPEDRRAHRHTSTAWTNWRDPSCQNPKILGSEFARYRPGRQHLVWVSLTISLGREGGDAWHEQRQRLAGRLLCVPLLVAVLREFF